MMMHICEPSSLGSREEVQEFKASLGYKMNLRLQETKEKGSGMAVFPKLRLECGRVLPNT